MTDERKSELVWLTISALNDGSKEAMEAAVAAREEAKASGDQTLIDHIEYLWEVI